MLDKEPHIDTGTLCRDKSPLPGPVGINSQSNLSIAAESEKIIRATRLDENEEYLKDSNVAAFIKAISAAGGGDYDLKYGGVKGKK